MQGDLGMDMDDDIFTSSEASFFSSHGQTFTPEPEKKEETTPDPNSSADPKSSGDPAKKTAEGEDEKVEGEIEITADGRAREKTTGRYVPAEAVRAKNQEIKETKAELRTLREQQARFLEILNRAVTPKADVKAEPKVEPIKLIDPAMDPVGAIQQERELRVKAEKERQESEQRQQAANTELGQRQAMAQDIGAFRSKTADFDEAMLHLTSTLERQRGRLMMFRDPVTGQPDQERIRKQVGEDIRAVALDAIAGKANAGKALYEWATEEFGFKPKAAQGAITVDPVKQASEAAAAVKAGEKTAAQQAVEQVGAGMDSARTLASSGGGTSTSGLTQESLATMSDDDLDDLADRARMNPELLAQLNRALGAR